MIKKKSVRVVFKTGELRVWDPQLTDVQYYMDRLIEISRIPPRYFRY